MNRWHRVLRSRWCQCAVALGLLAALYWAADWREVVATLANLHAGWLALALLLFIPQTLVSALRWRDLASKACRISLAQSLRQVLASSALNLVVPSKLGDLSKAAMLPLREPAARGHAAGLVVVEKGADVLALVAVVAIGTAASGWEWLLVAACAWGFLALVGASWWMRSAVASLVLWGLHVAQVHAFLAAAGVEVPGATAMGKVPLAIFAGLAPITLWGIGTRDSALIWLFGDVASASTLAAVGLLTALRYLVPGACGIPFVGSCFAAARCSSAVARAVPRSVEAGRAAVTT